MASPGAIAIIETPNSFVLEGRPDVPGALAYAGKAQLFGGHVGDEEPVAAIRRELIEEVGLRLSEDPKQLWSGWVDSQNKAGEVVRRHVSLFHVTVASVAELNLQVSGTIVEIAKTLADIEANQGTLTPFAFRALRKAVTGESWELES